MRQPGADLIRHYLDPDRLPFRDRWSRKHADTQRRLCERFAAPGQGALASREPRAPSSLLQIDQAARVIAVDRKVIEVAGHQHLEAPKNRKQRRTIYPRRTPVGYSLADRLCAGIEAARAEQEAGTNPSG